MYNPDIEIAIIGGGMAGLACAEKLRQAGKSFVLLEATDRVGGRVKTDTVRHFRLDHGFQILLDNYHNTQSLIDFETLDLKPFKSGALIRFDGKTHRFLDAWREPTGILGAATSSVGTFQDKLLVAKLRFALQGKAEGTLFTRENLSTEAFLRDYGFSPRMIDRFFRPFFGGIFLEKDLQTSRRMFEYLFSYFSDGSASLPRLGMEEIPRRLAAKLPPESIRLNTPVENIDGHTLTLANGETLTATHIVVATEGPSACKLLPQLPCGSGKAVTSLYLEAPTSPLKENIVVLNGSGEGLINNLCVPTDVSPDYGPVNKSLISVTVLGLHDPDSLIAPVLEELEEWYGEQVNRWTFLKAYPIAYALPDQTPDVFDPVAKPVKLMDHLYVCGDHRHTGSIEGAVTSGLAVAEELLREPKRD